MWCTMRYMGNLWTVSFLFILLCRAGIDHLLIAFKVGSFLWCYLVLEICLHVLFCKYHDKFVWTVEYEIIPFSVACTQVASECVHRKLGLIIVCSCNTTSTWDVVTGKLSERMKNCGKWRTVYSGFYLESDSFLSLHKRVFYYMWI